MRMKFFSIPVFDTETAERALNQFLAANRVLSFNDLSDRADANAQQDIETFVGEQLC